MTNRAFPGEITASLDRERVGPATLVSAEGPLLRGRPRGSGRRRRATDRRGDPLEFTVPLDGPVRLVARSRASGGVTDFVRFGVPVSSAFVPPRPPYERPGVALKLDSFGGVPNWSFFVRVAATGPRCSARGIGRDAGRPRRYRGGRGDRGVAPLLEVDPGGAHDGAIIVRAARRRAGSRSGSTSTAPTTRSARDPAALVTRPTSEA